MLWQQRAIADQPVSLFRQKYNLALIKSAGRPPCQHICLLSLSVPCLPRNDQNPTSSVPGRQNLLSLVTKRVKLIKHVHLPCLTWPHVVMAANNTLPIWDKSLWGRVKPPLRCDVVDKARSDRSDTVSQTNRRAIDFSHHGQPLYCTGKNRHHIRCHCLLEPLKAVLNPLINNIIFAVFLSRPLYAKQTIQLKSAACTSGA